MEVSDWPHTLTSLRSGEEVSMEKCAIPSLGVRIFGGSSLAHAVI